jgi:hypothetical protein
MALIGFLTLGDSIGQAGMTSILIGLIGVLLLSKTPEIRGGWFKRINNYPSKLGVYRDFYLEYLLFVIVARHLR